MERGTPSGQTGLLYATQTGNVELIRQLLEETGDASEDQLNIAERFDDITDFLDKIPRGKLPDATRRSLYEQGVAVLCKLVHSSDASLLRGRSNLLLPYLVASLDLRIPQLSASLWLMWLADRSSAEQSLREYGITSNRASVRLASVQELGKWVDAMNGRIAFRKFTPSVVKLLRDTDSSVRQAAYSLLVRFFASAKQPARDDLDEVMKKNQFSDALREKLMAAILNRTNNDTAASDDQLKDSSPISPLLGSHPDSHSTNAHPRGAVSSRQQPKRMSPPSSGNSPVLPASANPDYVDHPLYAMQDLDARNIRSDNEFITDVMKTLPSFDGKETEHNWSTRQEAIQLYRKMLRSNTHHPSHDAIREGFRLLQRGISDALLSMRTTLVTNTCQGVKDTAQILAGLPGFSELFDPIMDSLAKVATGIKKITAGVAHITICAVLVSSPSLSTRQFSIITSETKNLKPHAREYAFSWMKIALTTNAIQDMLPKQTEIESIVVKALTDAAPSGRSRGRELFWIMESAWPEAAQHVSLKVGPSALKHLQHNKMNSGLKIASKPLQMQPPATTLSSESKSPLQIRYQGLEKRQPSNLIPPTIPRLRSASPTKSRSPTSETASPSSRPTSPHLSDSSSSGTQKPSRLQIRSSVRTPPSRIPSPSAQQGISPNSGLHKSQSLPQEPESNLAAEPLAQSIADLSMRDLDDDGDSSTDSLRQRSPVAETLDFGNEKQISELSKADSTSVLRQLAAADLQPESIKSVLNMVKAANPALSSLGSISRAIQADIESCSQSLRQGYLKILRILDYESDETRRGYYIAGGDAKSSVAASSASSSSVNVSRQGSNTVSPTQPNKSLVTFPVSRNSTSSTPIKHSHIRSEIYADSESGDDSLASMASSKSSASNVSQTAYPAKISNNLADSKFIGPFQASPGECKAQITDMIEQVKQGVSDPSVLAALAVLVTASSSPVSNRASPIYTAVSIWRQHFTYDMQLRDAIIPFLTRDSTQQTVEQVIVALTLLRALLWCEVPHAAVYLDTRACLTALLTVSTNFGHLSLEIEEHLVPEIGTIVLNRDAPQINVHMHSLLELFKAALDSQGNQSGPKVFGLKIAAEMLKLCDASSESSPLDSSERRILKEMVATGIDNNDARVRKEVYPLLMAMHRYDTTLAAEAGEKLSNGQRQLLEYYLEETAAL